MINALWLIAIVPVSMAFGAVIAAIVAAVQAARDFKEEDPYRFGD